MDLAVRPGSSPITLAGARSRVHTPRRLTIPELKKYIRGGCFCLVCEFARAEIHARK